MKICYCLFAVIFLLSACNTQQKHAQDAASGADTLKVDEVPIPPLHLAGQSYTFGPQLDTGQCKSIAACDCCESVVLFPDDHRFIGIFLCLQDDTYAQGTYRVDGSRVYLSYEGRKVDVLTDFIARGDTLATKGDTTLDSIEYKVDDMPHSIDTLSAFMCHGVIGFHSQTIDYGMPDSVGSLELTMGHLRADSILGRMRFEQ